ncbi:MAG: spondin domain-containing protein [Bacteroidota bacterium]
MIRYTTRTAAVLVLLASLVPAVSAQVARFKVTVENAATAFPVLKSGVFNTPDGAAGPAPIFPGEQYTIEFTAAPGSQLSFATMFIQSNDLFYAFRPEGIALFDENGDPISGDVTDQVFLYDAGTEVDEEPGTGPNQAPRQSGPNMGEDENGVVELVQGENDGFSYPATADVIRVSIENDGSTGFTMTIENVSTANTLATSTGSVAVPLSPGAFAVHSPDITFYEVGAAANPGIEAIAEDGAAGVYAEALAPLTGVTVPLSPGAFAVHSEDVTFYTLGEAANAGIEAIAEDGNAGVYAEALATVDGVSRSGVFNTPVGAEGPGPIFPGGAYSFEVTARPGDRLSFATMYIQSNDFFLAFPGAGFELFDADGQPNGGDVTDQVFLYDAGTEVDEEPGVGPNQAPRQSGPNAGEEENGVIELVQGENDGFMYEDPSSVIRVTIEVVPATVFTVQIENVSTENTLTTSAGNVAVPLSPGAFAVHTENIAFYEVGASANAGIEAIAEDGNAGVYAGILTSVPEIQDSGVFNTPTGAADPGPIFPGGNYQFDVVATPGDRLSFSTMFIQSNDFFYAFQPDGLPLFDENGDAISGDVTDQVFLYDAGTEVDEEPGTGPNQAPRQSGPNMGEVENGVIELVQGTNDGFTYPETRNVISVTISVAGTVDTEDDIADIPDGFVLDQNYPNPFNPTTRIAYTLDQSMNVRLNVYDLTGRLVTTLVSGEQPAGSYQTQWNGLDARGQLVGSGVYLYRLEGDGFASPARRMVLLK